MTGTGTMPDVLRAVAADLRLRTGAPAGRGLEFEVWRMRHPEWGEVAVRFPARPVESNANDPWVETAELLRHEALVYRHLGPLGFPVPRVYGHYTYDVDVLVCEYLSGDGSAFSSYDLGGLLATLHELPVPAGISPSRSFEVFRDTLCERVFRRWSVLRGMHPELGPIPAARRLADMIPDDLTGSLLHLDVRAANLITTRGALRGVVDWSNSLVGDPALELARARLNAGLAENGLDADALWKGYAQVRDFPERTPECWNLYRLDAAVMLALVFTSEAPDPVRGPVLTQHAHELARKF